MKHTPIVGLDHITVHVRDLAEARKFYVAALGAIGMRMNLRFPSAFGMGSKDQNIFWLARDRKAAGNGHYALKVDHPEEVDAFHAAAVAAGGTDNGRPGPRPDYGPNYYAAFVKDGEGNNIEVVCYARTSLQRRPRAARPSSRRPSRRAGAARAKPHSERRSTRGARGR
jgi:catechol 2,3-dioxygenase-like lactoylglutathione lyase family enzyme